VTEIITKKLPSQSQIIIYKTETGETKIDVRFENETVWLTQNALADLFQTTKQNISQHIKNIFEEKELLETSTVKKFFTVQKEGSREIKREIDYYNLDLIISVGYRVKSSIATVFRQWATLQLREYIVKGFVMDDERLKNPDLPFDYFEELTRRISDIRTSEKRFYRKITDIYATSVDYDSTSDQSVKFFQTVQNKVHFAITGHTATEIIVNRINSHKKNLGLTTFRGNKPTKEEIIIAKNYYNQEELLQLNSLVEQYLIYATEQARRRIPMTMKDWITKLNGFLTMNDRNILKDAGKISHELMQEITNDKFTEYKKIEDHQDVDFDQIALDALSVAKIRNKK
jgi:hypothetical protein